LLTGGTGRDDHGVALVRAPTHSCQAERAYGRDLTGIGDAEARQGKRMRHPAQVEVDEHADPEFGGIDGGGDG
jgi:hypothetical protein